MIKKFITVLTVFITILFWFINSVKADNDENINLSEYVKSYELNYRTEFLLWEEASIDLTGFSDDLKITILIKK